MNHYVALDLGAESGRVMLGTLVEGKLQMEEVHRFPTGATAIGETLRWDVPCFFEQIKTGLRKIAARQIAPASISADSWGVDYVYFRANEPLLTLPFNYRDARTDGALEAAYARVPAEMIFEETGIQFMAINTLYQLLNDQEKRPDVMGLADHFLNMGDYFNYLLSGKAASEESLASTTQLYNPRQRAWSKKLIEKFGLPEKIFPPIVPSGTSLGPLIPSLAGELKWTETRIVATCSHDTGAAVAAVPAEGEDWAYLSSGTWSLLGIESSTPIITKESRACDFTNEAGLGGTTRFLKNIVGLWIVQECRRAWLKEGHDYAYDDLVRLATEAEPLQSFIHPADPRFPKPDRMPQKVADYCAETGQKVPATPGAIIRCVYESLALLYHKTVQQMQKISGRKIARLHIVGGGSKSDLFNQLVANATQIPVLAGPVEATAIGNMLVQALALGHLKSRDELRQVVRHSFPCKVYQPQQQAQWKEALQKFEKLTATL
ncbi:MAG TPA: rhamnulokinase family protein [Candidatus Methylacidiphilales bacterium]